MLWQSVDQRSGRLGQRRLTGMYGGRTEMSTRQSEESRSRLTNAACRFSPVQSRGRGVFTGFELPGS